MDLEGTKGQLDEEVYQENRSAIEGGVEKFSDEDDDSDDDDAIIARLVMERNYFQKKSELILAELEAANIKVSALSAQVSSLESIRPVPEEQPENEKERSKSVDQHLQEKISSANKQLEEMIASINAFSAKKSNPSPSQEVPVGIQPRKLNLPQAGAVKFDIEPTKRFSEEISSPNGLQPPRQQVPRRTSMAEYFAQMLPMSSTPTKAIQILDEESIVQMRIESRTKSGKRSGKTPRDNDESLTRLVDEERQKILILKQCLMRFADKLTVEETDALLDAGIIIHSIPDRADIAR